jgi:cyclopropane fatty-acyl-phospholipid synthase-like methyltransferase
MEQIRKETYGPDIGQNSWLTADEYDHFISLLNLNSGSSVLEVSSGSGGPARYLAAKVNCQVTGIDLDESGIVEAKNSAAKANQNHQLTFKTADANSTLPFGDNSFDAITCIDSMNHFTNRQSVFKEWHRVLKPAHMAIFTDPVVITGAVTNDELATRSSIGIFLFVPPGVNEEMIKNAGFNLIKKEDVTENEAKVSGNWQKSRERHKEALIKIEGEERFLGLQKFFSSVHKLTSEKRLSRIVYLVEKPNI